jgi:hypothetical protein
MNFQAISIAAGATDMPDPRTNPADVPSTAILQTPATLTSTDEQPPVCCLTLEGTAGQDCDVQLFVLDEGTKTTPGSRRFYATSAAPVVVTVGAISRVPAFPGEVYYRVTGAPVAAAVLKVGFKSGAPS